MERTTMSDAVIMREHEEILKTLEVLYHQSRAVLAENTLSPDDIVCLTISVTKVRRLLTELVEVEGRLQSDIRMSEWIADLHGRYWDLEGMTKEARNNLARPVRAM